MQVVERLIKNGLVHSNAGSSHLDIAIQKGKIVSVAPEVVGEAWQVIDATGKLVFPGFIDAHTHMGIPIMNTHSADDFESGSVAAACGGVTTVVDFTVQKPGQTLAESVAGRLGLAQGKSHVDFALHVNVTDQPGRRVTEIPALVAKGLIAYKVFSTYRQAGMMVTWDEFRDVLRVVDKSGGLLFLHAEDNDLVESATQRNVAAGNLAAMYHPRSRSAEAEARAISRAAEIAGELDARLYIVHLSSRAGLEAGLRARSQGVQIYLETCLQYLVLNEEIYNREDGHRWITTPPLRAKDDSDALWQALADGEIDVVATDHCPFTMAQKDAGGRRFHLTPNGIAGVETLFPLLYTYGVAEKRISTQTLVKALAETPARLLGLSKTKGRIAVGADADLVIWDPDQEQVITARNLHGNADWSPYEGLAIAGKIDRVLLRGQTIFQNGAFTGDRIFGTHITAAR